MLSKGLRTSQIPVLIAFACIMLSAPAHGEERPCIRFNECDLRDLERDFEQADKELAAQVRRILDYIEAHVWEQTRDEAKTEFAQAQRHWIAFRDSYCKAEAAWFPLSAQVPKARIATCMRRMTEQRLDELAKLFKEKQ